MLSRKIVLSMLFVIWVSQALTLAEEPSKKDPAEKFLRLVRDKDQKPVALEVAIVRYVPIDCGQTSPTVDLISAIHVAEKSYYDELNRTFEEYDAVLYEMVTRKDTEIPEDGAGGGNPLSMLQGGMTNLLDLEFQLEGIDYTRENLVHADMSPEQFSESMRNRGESMLEIFFKMLGYAMAKQTEDASGSGDLRMFMALFDSNSALAMKRIMAQQFEDMEGSLEVFGGPDGSTLITERNKTALEVLRKEIAGGKQKLAIFYGAGHMPDMGQRLRDDFGLAPIKTRWLVVWDLKGKSPKTQ